MKLGHAGDKRPHELSGGMRQRVAVARALAMNPRVMLLDEPLGALDALTRATLQDEIERIFRSERKTILLITNDVDEAILLADRIVPLSAGPAATLGPEVRVNLPRPRDRKALGRDPRFRAVRNEVLGYLLGPGSRQARAAERAAPTPARSSRPRHERAKTAGRRRRQTEPRQPRRPPRPRRGRPLPGVLPPLQELPRGPRSAGCRGLRSRHRQGGVRLPDRTLGLRQVHRPVDRRRAVGGQPGRRAARRAGGGRGRDRTGGSCSSRLACCPG